VSLSAHLTACTADHGRLAFHPDCPRCRTERLAGSLGTDSLASRRGQAALAAGLLAFSAGAAPAAAQAPGVDPQQRETPAPGGEPPGLSPDFDPGGEDTFDYETAPIPGGREAGGEYDEGTGAPVETEPLTDVEASPMGDTPELPTTPQPVPAPVPKPAPAPPAPAASPVPAEPSSPPATPISPAPAPPQQGELIERPEGEAAGGQLRRIRIGVEPQPPAAPRSTQIAAAAPAPVEAAEPTPAARSNAAAVPAAQSGDPAATVSQPPGPAPREIEGDAYTVRAGDSLWSIARRLLGPEASAGRIAREVNRLWELNRDRIGTGNPSLINVGTVIKL
jgi:hypothetical protein